MDVLSIHAYKCIALGVISKECLQNPVKIGTQLGVPYYENKDPWPGPYFLGIRDPHYGGFLSYYGTGINPWWPTNIICFTNAPTQQLMLSMPLTLRQTSVGLDLDIIRSYFPSCMASIS